mmetsp:Transcript_13976/g.34495  ORF Transcript_13976/g.34495 Transcript_13976/m.34495 type:complete len:373 (-) Transcript_13976:1732-2850(-)
MRRAPLVVVADGDQTLRAQRASVILRLELLLRRHAPPAAAHFDGEVGELARAREARHSLQLLGRKAQRHTQQRTAHRALLCVLALHHVAHGGRVVAGRRHRRRAARSAVAVERRNLLRNAKLVHVVAHGGACGAYGQIVARQARDARRRRRAHAALHHVVARGVRRRCAPLPMLVGGHRSKRGGSDAQLGPRQRRAVDHTAVHDVGDPLEQRRLQHSAERLLAPLDDGQQRQHAHHELRHTRAQRRRLLLLERANGRLDCTVVAIVALRRLVARRQREHGVLRHERKLRTAHRRVAIATRRLRDAGAKQPLTHGLEVDDAIGRRAAHTAVAGVATHSTAATRPWRRLGFHIEVSSGATHAAAGAAGAGATQQ